QHVLKGGKVLAIYGNLPLEKAQSVASVVFGPPSRDAAEIRDEIISMHAIPSTQRVTEPKAVVKRVEVNKTVQPVAGVIIGYDASSVIGDPANFPIDVADTMASGYGYPTGYLHEILRGQGLVYV